MNELAKEPNDRRRSKTNWEKCKKAETPKRKRENGKWEENKKRTQTQIEAKRNEAKRKKTAKR